MRTVSSRPISGSKGAPLRKALPVRTERCGVFSVSATVSDKNQGIPVEHALAVTMKSEVMKPCSRVPAGIDRVYLTGGVFRWRFMRECAEDALRARGVRDIRYDEDRSPVMLGMEALAADLPARSTVRAPAGRCPPQKRDGGAAPLLPGDPGAAGRRGQVRQAARRGA